MEKLLRTKAGQFLLEDSLRLSEVERLRDEGRLEEAILPVDEVFTAHPKAVLKKESSRLGYNGNSFRKTDLTVQDVKEGEIRVYDHAGAFIGIYAWHPGQRLYRPVKMFYQSPANGQIC